MIRAQIIDNLLSEDRIADESGYITLTNQEEKSLVKLSEDNKFFQSIAKNYARYSQLTINQYISLIQSLDRLSFQKLAPNCVPNFEPKDLVEIVKGEIYCLDEIKWKRSVQRNFRWEEEVSYFYVLNIVKDGIKYSASVSPKKLEEYKKEMIAGRKVSMKGKFKKIYKEAVSINYIKNLEFFD